MKLNELTATLRKLEPDSRDAFFFAHRPGGHVMGVCRYDAMNAIAKGIKAGTMNAPQLAELKQLFTDSPHFYEEGFADSSAFWIFLNRLEQLGYHVLGAGKPFNRLADALEGVGNKPNNGRKRQRRRRAANPTEKQLEALKIVGECEQDFTEAGRRMKLDPKTVRQHYDAGLRNAGKLASTLIGRPASKAIPTDHHGQIDVAADDDGPAAIGPLPRVHRNRR